MYQVSKVANETIKNKTMELTLEKIKENMSKVGMESMAVEMYMIFLVEKHYKKVGKKYLTIKDWQILQENNWEDIDENGIGPDGFDYLMNQEDINQNTIKKSNWEKIMKNNRVTLEEAFESIILNEK